MWNKMKATKSQEDMISRTIRFNWLGKMLLRLACNDCTFYEIYDLAMKDVEFAIIKVCTLKKNLLKEQSVSMLLKNKAKHEKISVHRTQFVHYTFGACDPCNKVEINKC